MGIQIPNLHTSNKTLARVKARTFMARRQDSLHAGEFTVQDNLGFNPATGDNPKATLSIRVDRSDSAIANRTGRCELSGSTELNACQMKEGVKFRGGTGTFFKILIFLFTFLLLSGGASPLRSQNADRSIPSSTPPITDSVIAENSKTFLDYVKTVQEEDKIYRESVEGFFTKITYILTFAGVLLGGLIAFVGFNTNKGIQKWLEANFNRMAGNQIETRTAALFVTLKKVEETMTEAQRQIEAQLSSAKKAEIHLTRMAEKANFNISYFFVTPEDWDVLKKLKGDGAALYSSKQQPRLRANLRRLRDRLELIEMQPNPDGGHYTVAKMPDEGDLKTFCKLTATGEEFVSFKLKEESASDD